jgi:hypothetical protein
MPEQWDSDIVYTNAEKARAAADLGKAAKQKGWSHKDAGDTAVHELKHALADKRKPGTLKLGKDEFSEYGQYIPVGRRSPEEIIDIARAPGDDMSPQDIAAESYARMHMNSTGNMAKDLWNSLFGWIKRF